MGPTQVAEQEQMATATETQVLAQAQVLAPAQVAVQVQVQLRSKPSISHLRAERAHQSMSQRAAVPSDENQTVAPERVALAQRGLAAMEPAAALLPDVLLGQVERAQSPVARVVRVPEQARPMSSR
jgi:hypothetical protein